MGDIKNEFIIYMDETTKNTLLKLQQLLNQNKVWYYASKILRLIFEFICYLLALMIFITGLTLPIDPIKTIQQLDESVSIINSIHIKELSELMIFIKIILVIFSVTLIGLGLSLRSIRRKNTIIKTSKDLIDYILITGTEYS